MMNKIAVQTLNKLKKHFDFHAGTPEIYAVNSIGVEIEVKWRDYFPTLWEKYLKNSSYQQLSETDKYLLTQECNQLEKILLPKLEQTIQCGIPKGADKYWEFAFNPVTKLNLIIDQIQLLQVNHLIPEGRHSLHLTIGNMKISKDVYYLLLILELLTCDIERIQSGFNKDNAKMSAAWGRKGLGGLFQKEARELKHNCLVAVEMRTLELTSEISIKDLLIITSYYADIIIDKQNNISNSLIPMWNNLLKQIKNILIQNNLADENWKKPNLSPNYWHHYIQSFPLLKEQIIEIVLNHESYPIKSLSQSIKLKK